MIGRFLKAKFDVTRFEASHVALGAALAMFLAFVPAKCGLVGVVLFLMAYTKASSLVTLVLGALLKPLSIFVLDATAVDLGRKVCESEWAEAHASWFAAPGIALLGLERYHVMGGAIIGLIAAIPAFIIFFNIQKGIRRVRGSVDAKLDERAKKKHEEAVAAAVAKGLPAPEAPKAEEPATGKRGLAGTLWMIFKPRKWVILGIALVCLELFGAKMLVKKTLQDELPKLIAQALGMVDEKGQVTKVGKVSWDESNDFTVSVVKGRIHLTDVHMANPKKPDEDLFSAKGIELKVNWLAMLRRRFEVELMQLDGPQMCVSRSEDGSLSIEPPAKPGEKQDPIATAQASDWASKAKKYFERAKEENEKRKKEREEEKKREEQAAKDGTSTTSAAKKPQTLEEVQQRATNGLPGDNDDLAALPHWVVKKVELSGLAIQVKDPTAPSFKFASSSIVDTASDQDPYGQPNVYKFSGAMLAPDGKTEQGKVELELTLMHRTDPAKAREWGLIVDLAGIDLKGLDGLFKSAVPLVFEKGTAKIHLVAAGYGFDEKLVAKPVLTLADVEAKPRDPNGTIIGMSAPKVADAITSASKEGPVELADVTIGGTLVSPTVDMGNTLKEIVVAGGINVGKRAAKDAVGKGIDEAAKKAGMGDKADDAKKAAGGAIDKIGGFLKGDKKE